MTIKENITEIKKQLGQDVICLFSGKRFYEAYCEDSDVVNQYCANVFADSRTSEGDKIGVAAFSIN